jgi:hemerythrin superfamily protein
MTSATRRGADTITSEDVVELILADHRAFEELLRALRSREEDRPARLGELADLLVAHAEAEEREVYPALKEALPRSEEDEVDHGAEEHAEGHEALLALQEADPEDHDSFEDALEELSEALTHHLDEEERDILNGAREHVSEGQRNELGRAFRRTRGELLQGTPGDERNVARLVEEARAEGLLDGD